MLLMATKHPGNKAPPGILAESRIKKAFKDVMSDRIARFYYVYERSGEIRNIGLDRDLVIWEH